MKKSKSNVKLIHIKSKKNLKSKDNIKNQKVTKILTFWIWKKFYFLPNSSWDINLKKEIEELEKEIEELKKENEELKKENEKLSENLREYEVTKAENELLREKMNLTEKYAAYNTVSADVINKDISNYGSNLILNVGTKDGIKEKMTVISDQGLVGYIVKASKDTSTVKVITDPASTVSCSISTTDESVICKGTLENNQTLRVTYIPLDADLIVGDSVETSGVGQIYAKRNSYWNN